jgi:hypothetical protein
MAAAPALMEARETAVREYRHRQEYNYQRTSEYLRVREATASNRIDTLPELEEVSQEEI